LIYTENTISRGCLQNYFKNKTVAILGSAPSLIENTAEYINSFDAVVRMNNFKIEGFEQYTGKRKDIYYSYFGSNIKKNINDLQDFKFLICKYPDIVFNPLELPNKELGKSDDFRWVYQRRRQVWVLPHYIPSEKEFTELFFLNGGTIMTTGVYAICDILKYDIKKLYISGFDFFESKIHNVNEVWYEHDRGGHDFKSEYNLIKYLTKIDKRIILDEHLRRRFNNDIQP